MSLTVPAAMQEQAARGEVPAEEFVVIVRDSLPYAYGLIAGLVAELRTSEREFADNLVAPPDERAGGQLLRARERLDPRCSGGPLRGPPGLPELPSGGGVPRRR